MKKETCRDCSCLIEDDQKRWACDEVEMPIEDIEKCPNGLVDFDVDTIWRYSINEGECGGIVFASSEKSAEEKVREKYAEGDISIWKMVDDDGYEKFFPYVCEIIKKAPISTRTYVGVLDDSKYGPSSTSIKVDLNDPEFNEEEVIAKLKAKLDFYEFDDPKERRTDASGIRGYFDGNKQHVVWFEWYIA